LNEKINKLTTWVSCAVYCLQSGVEQQLAHGQQSGAAAAAVSGVVDGKLRRMRSSRTSVDAARRSTTNYGTRIIADGRPCLVRRPSVNVLIHAKGRTTYVTPGIQKGPSRRNMGHRFVSDARCPAWRRQL